mgnify:CR=1 FL=1
MHHVKSTPSWAALVETVGRLEAAGLTVALGGSGLLAALGLADAVRDWDVTTDEPLERVTRALDGGPFTWHGSDALHADQKLALAGGEIEVIVGFAFYTPRGLVRIPTVVSARHHAVPLGSPACWAVAYHLLGREEKCERLFAHLARHAAETETIRRLLEEPLPPALAARLAAHLPSSST